MNHGKVSKDIAAGLLALKQRLAAAKIPSAKRDETLKIREFGKVRRPEAAMHYLAENLVEFDLTDLDRVLEILGSYWRAVYSDMDA